MFRDAKLPHTRFVVLGASNVTMSLSTAINTARLLLDNPLELLFACGHGRSYGRRSRVFARTLDGILECGLWDVLDQHPAEQTYAVITDVGNDILYGHSAAEIAGWVTVCVRRLQKHNARIAITELPLENTLRISPMKYYTLRQILFPKSRVTHVEVGACVRELNRRLAELAERESLRLIPQPATWYGLDPLHHRPALRAYIWRQLVGSAVGAEEAAIADFPRAPRCVKSWLHSRRLAPERRWIWGQERLRPQPAIWPRDGSRVWLY